MLSTGIAVFGTSAGSLFKSDDLTNSLKLFTSKVSSIRASLTNVVVGDLNGRVLMLDFSLATVKSYELGSSVISLDQDFNSTVVVGLSKGTVVQLRGENNTLLVSGHYKEGVSCLISLRGSSKFISAGADKAIVWDTHSHKAIDERSFSANVTCASQSKASGDLAFGLSNGTVEVWSPELTQKAKHKLTSNSTCLAWLGQTLAVGTVSGAISVFAGKAKHEANVGAEVSGVDWSDDDESTLQVCTSSGELKYFSQSAQAVEPIACRNFKWSTWTSKVGWHVPGILVPACPADKVTVVRSNANFVVVGDVWGIVRISGFPCPESCHWQLYRAHGSQVTAIEWSSKGDCFMSASSNCIMIFKTVF